MLDGYRKVDPPTQKKLPVLSDVPKLLVTTAYPPGMAEVQRATSDITMITFYYQAVKILSGPKYVSYDAQLCPIIVKSPSAPSAQATQLIANRHYEEVKSSYPDSQTLKNLF
jgi:hypothetical protein